MIYGGGPQSQAGVHAMVSAGIGGGVPIYVHENNGAALIILLGLWAGVQLFMYARARRARGAFIDEKIGEFTLNGAGGFLFGLLLTSILLVVIGK
jgi:hypothetical protein